MSSEILLELGIGETRAALVEDGRLVQIHIERDGSGPRAGDIWDARLVRQLIPRKRGIVDLGGVEALIEPIPAGVTEGGLLRVEVVREAIPERGRARLPKVQATGEAATRHGRVRPGSPLPVRLRHQEPALRTVSPNGRDLLELAGWSEAIEEAATGVVAFDGGVLTISLTPAMTVIDVDGALPPAALAVAGAEAAALAIRRFDITGSIGIDLPTAGDKAARQAAAAAIDAHLPPPFERTAVNGFGFIQIVRRRLRPSIMELVQGDPGATAALALLRRAEREPGAGERTLVAAPGVVAWLSARPNLIAELDRRIGYAVRLQADPGIPISGGYVSIQVR